MLAAAGLLFGQPCLPHFPRKEIESLAISKILSLFILFLPSNGMSHFIQIQL
jgi:hypothetical protein